jgi:hypothetical protein
MLFNGGGFAFQTSDETSGARTFDDKVKILINGNVGIGTTGPTAKLQIGSNVDPSQTAESLVHLLSSTAPTTANGFNILKLDYLAGNVAGDAGATIIFNQGYHSGNIDYTAPVGALRGYRTGPNYSYGGGLQLLYQPDAGALGLLVGMTLTGSGYVGIGLTAPSARLNTGVNVVGSFLPYLNGTGTSFTTATNIITVHDSSALGTNTTAGLMLINNNNSNDAPSPLIAFSARSTSNTYNHTYAAIWGEKDSTGADTNWNTGGLIFATSTSTGPYERMRINPVGNVGIGTPTPNYKLEVKDSQDSSLFSGLVVERSANTTAVCLNAVGGALNLNTNSSMPIKFRIGNTSMQTINTDGGRAYAGFGGWRMFEYSYSVSIANGATVDLFQNVSAHTDLHMVQIAIRMFHSGRTYYVGSGTVGGYGMNITGSGTGHTNGGLTSALVSSGIRKLQITQSSGYTAVTGIYIQFRLDSYSAITVLNGTLSSL